LLGFLDSKFSNVGTEVSFDWCPSLTNSTRARLKFDFVIKKIIIELDGPQHFKQIMEWKSPEDQRVSDLRKMQLANANGYAVIRIIQEDVYYNRCEWKPELLEAINSISPGQDIFLCKNGEYEEMIAQLKT
jgi:hypothetical protein